jgi:preprotein translocase subunit SecF
MSALSRLYSGDVTYDFIGRRRRWFAVSTVLVVASILFIALRGFNFGIEFKGGASFQFPAHGHSVATVQKALSSAGVTDPTVQTVGQGQIRVTTPPLTTEQQVSAVQNALATATGNPPTSLNPSTIGASWGGQITSKALQGLVIFLIVVAIYIAIRFEARMAVAAFVALLHDLIITAGVYSAVGFEVTPSTVIAVLTILGFSLYDTVVVFDKVRENTDGLTKSRLTYAELANLALDQTLMRSINTSLIALLPVAALLFVGAGILGVGTLKDLALAQFVGLAAGAYSSIFLATPLLVVLKQRDPAVAEHDARIARQRRARGITADDVLGRTPSGAQAGAAAGSSAGAGTAEGTGNSGG